MRRICFQKAGPRRSQSSHLRRAWSTSENPEANRNDGSDQPVHKGEPEEELAPAQRRRQIGVHHVRLDHHHERKSAQEIDKTVAPAAAFAAIRGQAFARDLQLCLSVSAAVPVAHSRFAAAAIREPGFACISCISWFTL